MKIINPVEIEISDENVAKITVNKLIEMLGCKGIPYISIGGDLVDTIWTADCIVPSDRKKNNLRKSNDMDKAIIMVINEITAVFGVEAYGDH